MATPQAPLMTRISMTADWHSGYAVLLDEPGWPPAVIAIHEQIAVDLAGYRNWASRRLAMRRLAMEFNNGGALDLYSGASLLATDPSYGPDCSEIASQLTAEMSLHNLTEAADAIKGWAVLAEGCPNSEEDPIKASHLAAKAAAEYASAAEKHWPVPTSDELATAPILDNWESVKLWLRPERWSIRGLVSGRSGGSQIVVDQIEMDLNHRWGRTVGVVYRLGYRKHELAPIVRAALKPTRRDAFNLIFGITGSHTLEAVLLKSARVAGDSKAGRGEQTAAAKTVADRLYVTGRVQIARAWYMLAADDVDSCIVASAFLTKDAAGAEEKTDGEVKMVVAGWQMLAGGLTSGEDVTDLIAAAHKIGGRQMRNDLDEPEKSKAPGVVVLPEIGGTRETSTAKEARREFRGIAGVRIPLALAPDMARVRRVLHDEFPYAQQQIDLLLTGMIEGEPIRWRHALLVSKPGSGKSRLARRLAEELGIGLHRYDGSGSSDNAFGGTPRRWSSGEHCVPLEAVRRHRVGNVLILVDEIDKSGNSRHNGRLEHALMPFLEKETARKFPDPYVESDLNLSFVGFFLTCNSVDEIPDPLRDRLRVVRLPEPKREHLPALVRCIVADIAKETESDPRWWPMLDDGELAIAETLWKGGSVRHLCAIVERILAYRESNPRN
jgi:ATP-dependent Lon protease